MINPIWNEFVADDDTHFNMMSIYHVEMICLDGNVVCQLFELAIENPNVKCVFMICSHINDSVVYVLYDGQKWSHYGAYNEPQWVLTVTDKRIIDDYIRKYYPWTNE